MTQRCIEMLVGRLATDEVFRRRFQDDPHRLLGELVEDGTHLNQVEMAALIATDATLWERVADQIDPRLQRADLTTSDTEP